MIQAIDPRTSMAKPQPVTRAPRLAAVISAPMIVSTVAVQLAMFSMRHYEGTHPYFAKG